MAFSKQLEFSTGAQAEYLKIIKVNRNRQELSGEIVLALFKDRDASVAKKDFGKSWSFKYNESNQPFTSEARSDKDDDKIAYEFVKSQIASVDEDGRSEYAELIGLSDV